MARWLPWFVLLLGGCLEAPTPFVDGRDVLEVVDTDALDRPDSQPAPDTLAADTGPAPDTSDPDTGPAPDTSDADTSDRDTSDPDTSDPLDTSADPDTSDPLDTSVDPDTSGPLDTSGPPDASDPPDTIAPPDDTTAPPSPAELVTTMSDDAAGLGNDRLNLGLSQASGWLPSTLRGPSGSGVELLYGEPVNRERWVGVLLFDESGAFEDAAAPTALELGPALVHLRKAWDVGMTGSTDLVVHADGRIHLAFGANVLADVNGGWLVSHVVIPASAVSRVQAGDAAPTPLPTGNTTAGSQTFVGGLDLGDVAYLCAFEPVIGDVVGWIAHDSGGGAALQARITESAVGGAAPHSIRLQHDWRRGGVTAGAYTGEFLLVTAAGATCASVAAWAAAFRDPPPLLVVAGALVTGAAGDPDGDGYAEAAGYYRVATSAGGQLVSVESDVALPGLTLRVEAADLTPPVSVTLGAVPLVDGVDFLAQTADSGAPGGFVALLRGLPAGTTLTVSW